MGYEAWSILDLDVGCEMSQQGDRGLSGAAQCHPRRPIACNKANIRLVS